MDSFICWLGGKSKLSNWIINQMPPHKMYVEVFGGAGWVLFRKPRSEKEIFNDIDSDLINLFICCRDKPNELVKAMEFLPQSRELHRLFYTESLKMKAKLGDVDRAAKFFYVLNYAFQGHLGSYRVHPGGTSEIESYLYQMAKCSYRLRRVSIENLDWKKLIENTDGPETLFYLDPPYTSTIVSKDRKHRDYSHLMDSSDHDALAETLKHIEGKFLLSYDDSPEVRKLYGGGTWAHLTTTPEVFYSGQTTKQHRRPILKHELLISNFPLLKKKSTTERR